MQENEQETQQGSEMLLLNKTTHTPTHTQSNNRAKINDHDISVCVCMVCIGAPEISVQ